PTTARYVLHAFGASGGWRPGNFTESLISLIARADHDNAARLATIYPAEAAAVRIAKYDENGIATLQALAAGKQVAA
ncbi:hypothetical protein EAO70_06145, partial [Streptomyces sp. adm13(2018)]|uniref:hypothetical protein n=1 Tax=Streptomyces sp. adm13(2018) TaxID=2479007 RepID=UPI0013A49D15